MAAINYIHINNADHQLTTNFNMKEFFKPTLGGHGEFDMPDCLYKAAQVVRDFYGAEVDVTSVFRPYDWGEHKIGCACDLVAHAWSKKKQFLEDIRSEFKNWANSKLVKDILDTGVTVLIIENVCLHLAYRQNKLGNHPNFEPSKFYIGEWTNDGTKYGKNIRYA